MIPIITVGSGARGCLDYLSDTEGKNQKIVEYIGGNAIGITVDDLALEFHSTTKLRPNLNKYLAHFSLSAAPTDGVLDTFKWRDIADSFLKKIGFNLRQTIYTIIRHSETDNDHIHIVASRIMLDGAVWDDGRSKLRIRKACRELEKQFGLTEVKTAKAEKKGLNKDDKAKRKKGTDTGDLVTIQECIDELLKRGIHAPDFIRALKEEGITARPNIASTGRLNGFSFRIGEVAYKGSELGQNYSLNSLFKRGLNYEPVKHAPKLMALADEQKALSPAEAPPSKPRKPVGEISDKEILRRGINLILRAQPTSLADFVTQLRASGIEVKASLGLHGRLSGFRYIYGELSLKGSELGYDYTLAGLEDHGLIYYQDADFGPLKAALKLPVAESESQTIKQRALQAWPDRISAGFEPYQKINDDNFWAFIRDYNLFWKKIAGSNDRIFYNQVGGGKRGIAFIDRGDRLDVEIDYDANILAALVFGAQKWGTVRVSGSHDFIARAKEIALANGFILATDDTTAKPTTLQAQEHEESEVASQPIIFKIPDLLTMAMTHILVVFDLEESEQARQASINALQHFERLLSTARQRNFISTDMAEIYFSNADYRNIRPDQFPQAQNYIRYILGLPELPFASDEHEDTGKTGMVPQ